MSTAGRSIFQALTLCHLLAAAWNVAAEDSDPLPVSQPMCMAGEQLSQAESGAVGVGSARAEDTRTRSLLVTGIGWPLFGGILVLAAVNGRKPKARRNKRAWHWPW
jgi:hypothetical protein